MVVLGVDRPTAERELVIADRARETYSDRRGRPYALALSRPTV